jgi:hypothetical protein
MPASSTSAPSSAPPRPTRTPPAEGLAIAHAIKADLPGWTVVHHDEAAAQRAGRDAPRRVFEYAV